MKKCKTCGQLLDNSFFKIKSNICGACDKARVYEWFEKTKKKRLANKKAAKKKRGVSDGYLNSLFRRAVLKRWHNTCVICGRQSEDSRLEAHHFVKRRVTFLRHDEKNGVCVCKGECHRQADTLNGIKIIIDKIGEKDYIYLRNKEKMNFKNYLTEFGMTTKEFRTIAKNKLKLFLELDE